MPVGAEMGFFGYSYEGQGDDEKKNCLGAISSGDYGGGISNVTLEVT